MQQGRVDAAFNGVRQEVKHKIAAKRKLTKSLGIQADRRKLFRAIKAIRDLSSAVYTEQLAEARGLDLIHKTGNCLFRAVKFARQVAKCDVLAAEEQYGVQRQQFLGRFSVGVPFSAHFIAPRNLYAAHRG
jgi:hypothetical protein